MKKIIVSLFVSVLSLSAVTFQGNPVELNNHGLKVGDVAPKFHAVTKDLKEITIGGAKDKMQIIAFVPSIDTGVCALETIRFNRDMKNIKNANLYVVSKDLPFALGRFCNTNKIKNVTTVSDYKDDNHALRYGATLTAPASLEGYFARVVYIINTNGKVIYKEVVNEIVEQPNYDRIKQIINK